MSWPSAKIGELLDDVQPGFASGKNLEEGTLQIRMNNVKPDGSWDWSKKRRVPATEKQVQKYSAIDGDILFNTTNSPALVGKSALLREPNEAITFSNHFLRLRVDAARLNQSYLVRYLAYLWKHRVFENMVDSWVNQSTVQRDKLLSIQVPLPPLEEQIRIAAILDKADAIRRKRQQAIALADQFLKSVFLDMFGDPVTNPKGWPISKLSKMAELINGDRSSNYPSGG